MGTEASITSIARKGRDSDQARIRKATLVTRLLRRPELGALCGAVLIYAVFYIMAGSSGMFTIEGIINILRVSAEIGILAAAAALLMIAGEFDLSIGSMIGFAGVIIGLSTTVYDLPLSIAVLSAFVVCGLIGVANGWLTVKTGLPSFIVTLASMLILRGLAISITRYVNGYTQISKITGGDPDSWIIPLFSGRLGGTFLFGWPIKAGLRPSPTGYPVLKGFPSRLSGGWG